jgi:O-antigen/teichoic acid export membrane protein
MSAEVDMSGTEASSGKRVLGGGLWHAASMVIPLLGTAALSATAGHILGPEILGQQSLIAYIDALLNAVFLVSLRHVTLRGYGSAVALGAEDQVAAIARWSTVMHLAIGSATMLTLGGIGLTRTDQRVAWFLVALNSLLNAGAAATTTRVVGRFGWGGVSVRYTITQLIAAAGGIVGVVAGGGIAAIFAANLVSTALLVCLIRRLDTGRRPGVGGFHWPVGYRRLWSWFVVQQVVVEVVGRRVELLFLAGDGRSMAMYSVAFMVVGTAAALPGSIIGSSMYAVAGVDAHDGRERSVAVLRRSLEIALSVSVPMAAMVTVAGPPLVRLVYGSNFEEAAGLVPLAALGLLVTPTLMLFNTFWNAVGNPARPFAAAAIGSVADLALAASLIPSYGAKGAVFANLGGAFVTTAAIVVLTRRTLPTMPHWRGLFGSLAAAGAALIAGLLVDRVVDGWITTFVVGAAAALTYLVVATHGILRPDTGRWLSDTVPGPLRPLVSHITVSRAPADRSR